MNEEYITWEEKVLDQLERCVKYDKPITRKQAEETIDFICEQDNVIDKIGNQRDKQKEVLDKIKEYIKENTRYYDKELGLVEMMGAGNTRTPVIYLYGLLELLEEIE